MGIKPGHRDRRIAEPRRRPWPASSTRAARRCDEVRQLIERLQPTLPILLANLVSVGQVAVTYQNDIEQLLVVFPKPVTAEQAGIVRATPTPNRPTRAST